MKAIVTPSVTQNSSQLLILLYIILIDESQEPFVKRCINKKEEPVPSSNHSLHCTLKNLRVEKNIFVFCYHIVNFAIHNCDNSLLWNIIIV